MSSIELHKTKGINVHLTYCPRCLGEAKELAFLGKHDGVYACNCLTSEGGPHRVIGRPKDGICPATKRHADFTLERHLEEMERVPASDLCDLCKQSIEMVKAGGIFWECKDCRSMGAITKDAPLAIKVREEMKIAAPNPVGIDFSKDFLCPICGPEKARFKAQVDAQLKEREGRTDGTQGEQNNVPPPG